MCETKYAELEMKEVFFFWYVSSRFFPPPSVSRLCHVLVSRLQVTTPPLLPATSSSTFFHLRRQNEKEMGAKRSREKGKRRRRSASGLLMSLPPPFPSAMSGPATVMVSTLPLFSGGEKYTSLHSFSQKKYFSLANPFPRFRPLVGLVCHVLLPPPRLGRKCRDQT